MSLLDRFFDVFRKNTGSVSNPDFKQKNNPIPKGIGLFLAQKEGFEVRLVVPGNLFGLTLILQIADHCGNFSCAVSATGSAQEKFLLRFPRESSNPTRMHKKRQIGKILSVFFGAEGGI